MTAKKESYLMEQTMRWFGPSDPVSLSAIRQAGCSGVVTALHHIPNGEVWTIDEISRRKKQVEDAGLSWHVTESLPVHEKIKTQSPGFGLLIENYCASLENLSSCGIDTVTYNFMPVMDWTRTDLEWLLPSGAKALRFEKAAFIAFDLYLLKRPSAEKEYSKAELEQAAAKWDELEEEGKQRLASNIIKGLPGSEESFSIEDFRNALELYRDIDSNKLRDHLVYFLEAVVPIAEKCGINLVIHPDDPPYPLLGLPRVVSTASDLAYLFSRVPSLHNGLCFCTGSFGVRSDNDLPAMIRKFGERIGFLHLRSIKRNENGDFFEDDHLEGDVDMVAVVKEIVHLMRQRGISIPMRPDHGHQLLDDLQKITNPGYSAIGRLKGLAELRGLERGLVNSLT